jgi:isocitrate/isopropylmalate dehydrogenase
MNEIKLLPGAGDGIGPEVMDATMRVVGWFGQKGLAYKTEEALLGRRRHRHRRPS